MFVTCMDSETMQLLTCVVQTGLNLQRKYAIGGKKTLESEEKSCLKKGKRKISEKRK